MLFRVGTSGYTYFWNEGKPTPFEWYLKQGFNSVEINASFYRFPSRDWVKVWAKAPRDFTFSIKVHRLITHYAKLRGRAVEYWRRFKEPLKPIEDKIEFWLFQMPPSYIYKPANVESLETFFMSVELGDKAVVEFRDPSWWQAVREVEKAGAVFCSVDAPSLPRDIVVSKGVVYLRLHGREEWYNYIYSEHELNDIVIRIRKLRAGKNAIYLNNNHGMLDNGLYLMRRLMGGWPRAL